MTELQKIYDVNLANVFEEYDSLLEFDMPKEIGELENDMIKFQNILDFLKDEPEVTIAVREGYEEYKIYSVINSDNPYIEEYEGTTNGDNLAEFLEEAKCVQIASGPEECFGKLNEITNSNYKVIDGFHIEYDYE